MTTSILRMFLKISALVMVSIGAAAAGVRDSGGAPPPPKSVELNLAYKCQLYLWENETSAVYSFHVGSANGKWNNLSVFPAPQDWKPNHLPTGEPIALAQQLSNHHVNFNVTTDSKKRLWMEAEIAMDLQFGEAKLETKSRARSLVDDGTLSGDANLFVSPNQEYFSLSLVCEKTSSATP